MVKMSEELALQEIPEEELVETQENLDQNKLLTLKSKIESLKNILSELKQCRKSCKDASKIIGEMSGFKKS